MGRITTLYGYIQELPDREQKYHAHNQRVLSELPQQSEWPFLNAGLFHLPKADDASQISYWGRVIPFGGSYKALEDGWEEWLVKFESLLEQLIWCEAKAHLITEWYGEKVCEWIVSSQYSTQVYKSSEIITPTSADWSFTGPRNIQ